VRDDNDMYDIAEQVRSWLAEGCDVRVASVVATRGFSSGEPVASAAWTSGGRAVGHLVPGLPVQHLTATGLVELEVAEQEAQAAGLSCAGAATVLVQPADAFPEETWDRLARREPLCLVVSFLDETATTSMYTPATVGTAYEFASEVPRLFGRGVSGALTLSADPVTVAIALWPSTRLVVVGDGLIADALGAQAELLGWRVQVTGDVVDAVAAAADLHRSDAFVVLSHDPEVDGPALAAALDGGAGYVGALGSRRTQERRHEWLAGRGVPGRQRARIHGPAGLDVDAHTPAEIAVAIAAEILAERGGASGRPLRERDGAIHGHGVSAPPPRY
jgi:xanthine dehydrogenase accessory factor